MVETEPLRQKGASISHSSFEYRGSTVSVQLIALRGAIYSEKALTCLAALGSSILWAEIEINGVTAH